MVEKFDSLFALARKLQQIICANDVRLDKIVRRDDRAINVGLGSEVTDSVNGVLIDDLCNRVPVADISLDEQVPVAGMPCKILQAEWVPGVGQHVDVDDAPAKIRFLQKIANKIGPDETTSACHHQVFH